LSASRKDVRDFVFLFVLLFYCFLRVEPIDSIEGDVESKKFEEKWMEYRRNNMPTKFDRSL
jgi:hypothetical protein